MKDIAKSVRARLLNIAKEQGLNFQLLVLRYFHERFLYRLSQSSYGQNFYLKGGVLLYTFTGLKTRPTIDIDFLVRKLKLTPEKAREIFKNICSIQYPDGVVFDTENITAQQIIEQAKYKGIRVKIIAKLDTIKQPLQIDLGIGDALFKPLEVEYPTLLDFDNPVILAYSPHSVIAEKFEAMIWLSEINSRMKDFYDVYTLLKSENLDKENLRMAIKQTFEHRQTEFTYPHPLFNEAFPRDTDRIKQWEAFLKRNKLLLNLSFYEVWKEIVSVLEPIYKELSQADN